MDAVEGVLGDEELQALDSQGELPQGELALASKAVLFQVRQIPSFV